MTDAELLIYANKYADELVPDQKYSMSMNKYDLRQGFIDGAKFILNRGINETSNDCGGDNSIRVGGNFIDEILG